VTLNNSTAQTVTVSTADQTVQGISSTVSLAATAGEDGVASATATWSVTVNYSYTQTETRTTSETQTVVLIISETVNAPKLSSYIATLLVNIGHMPPAVYHTTAQRWYDEQVTGSEIDPDYPEWYLRVEPVMVTVGGSLRSSTTVDIDATPLPK
jgi:hypothetical protein